jgi:Uma2 family endonuclease
MTSVETLLTAEEFASLPEPEEGGKMELVDGKVVCMPPAGDEHGHRALKLGRRLDEFAERHAQGEVKVETGFLLRRTPDLLRAPDVSFIADEMLAPERDRSGYIEGPPTLAIEVVSPGDHEMEISGKVGDYLEAGARRVWIVRPRLRTITVHCPGGDSHTYGIEDTLTSDDAGFAVEGFELPLRDAFR